MKNRRARPSYFAISGTKSHNCPVYYRTCCCQGVSHPLLVFVDYLRRKWQVIKVHVSFYAASNSVTHKYFAKSLLHLFTGAIDHKGFLRGRCTLCPCVAYKQAKISNKCAECCCPSSVHVSKGTLFTIFLPGRHKTSVYHLK